MSGVKGGGELGASLLGAALLVVATTDGMTGACG